MAEISVPSLERAIDLLFLLEKYPKGLSAQELHTQSKIPRATLFRILRVLSDRGFIQQYDNTDGLYQLGPTIARLGTQVQVPRDLISISTPLIEALSEKIGETVKLVMRDGLEAVTVAVSRSKLEARVSSMVGTRLPLHLGVSQRLLLSRAPQAVVQQVLEGLLVKKTSKTITDPARLQASLEVLREQNSASGEGEGQMGIGAAAALVNNADGNAIAALVAVYIAPSKSNQEVQRIQRAVEQFALKISALKPSL
ncbi:IclR family transcriptional regulator [Advenella mimigardefordensis]|nr:IclR family transcriptional regulator [Advenella mimigardefordensis]